MAKSRMPRLLRLGLLVLSLASTLSMADDDDQVASTSAESDLPQWATDNMLMLELKIGDTPKLPSQYHVFPLTENLGLNETQTKRSATHIQGTLVAANQSNYNDINGADDVAYLSCDEPSDDSFIDPNKMLNELMNLNPRAIILYSTSGNWCSLSSDGDLPYTSILSIADSGESSELLGYLNGTETTETVSVFINGNTSDDSGFDSGSGSGGGGGGGGGGGSAAAMTALYSITGVIVLLFVVIVSVGAIRAHRHPERYGPRRGNNGRPRQSRAKGIARAMLETIPIVKFGNQEPQKPDPELEMDAATIDGEDRATQQGNADDANGQQSTVAEVSGARPASIGSAREKSHSSQQQSAVPEPEHLGCSICTEDFKNGEDVRVLPCNHQFHPTCIDPWLINVSGTCPLCRLDLRPGVASASNEPEASAAEGDNLPPPLAIEGDEAAAAAASTTRTRASRLFDFTRLRHATTEEQLSALRQMRAQMEENPAAETEAEAEESPQHRARLSDRLKEKFRIKTRAQSQQGEQC